MIMTALWQIDPVFRYGFKVRGQRGGRRRIRREEERRGPWRRRQQKAVAPVEPAQGYLLVALEEGRRRRIVEAPRRVRGHGDCLRLLPVQVAHRRDQIPLVLHSYLRLLRPDVEVGVTARE